MGCFFIPKPKRSLPDLHSLKPESELLSAPLLPSGLGRSSGATAPGEMGRVTENVGELQSYSEPESGLLPGCVGNRACPLR